MDSQKNPLIIIAMLLSAFSLILSLFALGSFTAKYSELEELPDLSGYGNYGNLTGIPNIDLMHGLCLWLPFDGVLLDKSGFSHNGVGDGLVSYVSGFHSRALSCNGINTSVRILRDLSLEPEYGLTICSWVYPLDGGDSSERSILRHDYAGLRDVPYDVHIKINVGKWRAILNTNISIAVVYPSISIVYGSWQFLCVQWDGAYARFGVNGTYGSSVALSGKLLSGGSGDVYVSKPDLLFYGLVDDLHFYNRVLSDYEIFTLYTLGN